MHVPAKILALALFLSLAACTLFQTAEHGSKTVTNAERRALERRLDHMEDALEQNRALDVARVYFDSAYLLAPGMQPVTGREAINRYWQGLDNVQSWELETLLTTRNVEEIYAHEAYRRLKTRPPGWEKLVDKTGLAVYQLGTSDLRYKDREGKDRTSKVTYILLWEAARDGGWRIRVDTYSGG
jgi:ketosteroid isomerase-like protein